MASTQTTIKIPDTKLASEAHDILREYATDLLYNHSNRVYFSLPNRAASKVCASIPNCSTSAQRSTTSACYASILARVSASK